MVSDSPTVDFDHLTISRVEELVGRKPIDVRMEGKWVVLSFGGASEQDENGVTKVGAGIIIRFKQW